MISEKPMNCELAGCCPMLLPNISVVEHTLSLLLLQMGGIEQYIYSVCDTLWLSGCLVFFLLWLKHLMEPALCRESFQWNWNRLKCAPRLKPPMAIAHKSSMNEDEMISFTSSGASNNKCYNDKAGAFSFKSIQLTFYFFNGHRITAVFAYYPAKYSFIFTRICLNQSFIRVYSNHSISG